MSDVLCVVLYSNPIISDVLWAVLFNNPIMNDILNVGSCNNPVLSVKRVKPLHDLLCVV